MEEERIVNLLKFSIKPIKSAREENDFNNACQLFKTESNKVRKLGDKKCSTLEEKSPDNNICLLLEILSDFNIATNSTEEDLLFLHNGVFFVKWLFCTYSEDIGKVLRLHDQTCKTFVDLLVTLISSIEVTKETYHVVMEATDILSIVSYSTGLLNVQGKEEALMQSLLRNFIAQEPAPVFPFGLSSSIGFNLAAGMWSIMTVGYVF